MNKSDSNIIEAHTKTAAATINFNVLLGTGEGASGCFGEAAASFLTKESFMIIPNHNRLAIPKNVNPRFQIQHI
ncbi:MAG: hypothetical protein NWE77_08795 [Candidatus Bathyarchaeota archaeon]|nr:hypothetical protein [Candidatus Bathyarchaeota archaeon]